MSDSRERDPDGRAKSDPPNPLIDANLKNLRWPLTVFVVWLIILASVGVCAPAIRSEVFDTLWVTLCSCLFPFCWGMHGDLRGILVRILAWLLLAVAIVPQLVLFWIFGIPKIWPQG